MDQDYKEFFSARGRPKLPRDEEGRIISSRGAKIADRWNPKEWRPEYELVVQFSLTNPASEISRLTGYTIQHVSNILSSDRGKESKALMVLALRKEVSGNVGERIGNLNLTALENVENVLNNEKLKINAPLEIFDRSFKYLQATGELGQLNKKDPVSKEISVNINNVQNTQNNVFTTESINALRDELRLANSVRERHSNLPKEILPPAKNPSLVGPDITNHHAILPPHAESLGMGAFTQKDTRELILGEVNAATKKVG